jgi:hypothetical protein
VKPKADARPKKVSLLRSWAAIGALMIASAGGGYMFAEYRQQQALEDARAMHDELRGMRDEINAKLLALAQTTEHLAHDRAADGESPADIESTVLARGPVDRACEETGSASPCDAAPQSTPTTPAVAASAGDGGL